MHEIRYTGIERFLFITMSRTSGVTEGLYGLVVRGVWSKDQTGILIGIST